MGTFSPNLQLSEPTPGDPAVTNSWGAILNTNFVLIDNAVTGVLPLSLTTGTVTLTSTAGASDQARNRLFTLTGTLTGAVTILFPAGLARFFSIQNLTTGAQTVTIAANNGSGAAAGSVLIAPQATITPALSDGTNVFADGGATGMLMLQSVQNTRAVVTAFNSATASAYLSQLFTPQSAGSTIVIRATLNYETNIINGATTNCAIMGASLRRAGSVIGVPVQAGGSSLETGVAGLVLSPLGSLSMVFQEPSPGTSIVTYAVYCSDTLASGLTNNAVNATILIQEFL